MDKQKIKLANVEVDLVDIIRQAVTQVWGSDERDILWEWLGRNTEPEQIVKINLTYTPVEGKEQ